MLAPIVLPINVHAMWGNLPFETTNTKNESAFGLLPALGLILGAVIVSIIGVGLWWWFSSNVRNR